MLITRALSDPQFRVAFALKPEQILAKAGFEASPDEVKAIALARLADLKLSKGDIGCDPFSSFSATISSSRLPMKGLPY
jgi:hypothetical protein